MLIHDGDRDGAPLLGDCIIPLDESLKRDLVDGKVDSWFPLFYKLADGAVQDGGEVRLALTADFDATYAPACPWALPYPREGGRCPRAPEGQGRLPKWCHSQHEAPRFMG